MYDLLYVLGMDNTPKKAQYMKGLIGLYEQALQIAPGFADTIKPDGTLFHHGGVYMNAYGDHAMQTASLIAYLLSGTPYALSDGAKITSKSTTHTRAGFQYIHHARRGNRTFPHYDQPADESAGILLSGHGQYPSRHGACVYLHETLESSIQVGARPIQTSRLVRC